MSNSKVLVTFTKKAPHHSVGTSITFNFGNMKNPPTSGPYGSAAWTVYTIKDKIKIKSKTYNNSPPSFNQGTFSLASVIPANMDKI